MTRVEVAPVTGTACSGLSTWPQDTTWLQRGVVRYVFLSLSLSHYSLNTVCQTLQELRPSTQSDAKRAP